MKYNRQKNKDMVRKTAGGALLSALACVLLIAGGIFEILDMTGAAAASVAVLAAYLEFGTSTALAVYASSAAISLIFFSTASSTIYYVLILGYFPIFKFFIDKKFKKHFFLSRILKFTVFNLGSLAVLLLFFKIYGIQEVIKEFTVSFISPYAAAVFVFVLLNIFLIAYDISLNMLSVIYMRVIKKRIFPHK